MQRVLELDRTPLIWINGHRSLPLDLLLLPVSFVGEFGLIWIAVGAGMLILGRPPVRRTGLVLLATIIVAGLVAVKVDRLIDSRPATKKPGRGTRLTEQDRCGEAG